MIYNSMKPGFIIFFHCILITTQVNSQHFTTIKSEEGIEIIETGKKVLFYQVRPKTVDGKYERAGYVHPLYNLNEKIITEDMPEDHPYHRGIFWAWHQIVLNKKNIADGWTSENISWAPVKVNVRKKKKSIIINSELSWNSALEKNIPVPIVREKTKIIVYKSNSQYRIIDFEINLFALIDSLEIGGSDDAKGYGGFCLRLKLPPDISFLSKNETITPEETPVFAGPWMDFSGSFDGSSHPQTGIIVFCHPTGNQQPWILRKEKSMQNVPFPGRSPVLLSKNGWKLSYRVIIHNGMSNEAIEKLYREYSGD